MILCSTVMYQLGLFTHINTTLGLFLQRHVPPKNPPIIKNKITSLVGEEKNMRCLLKDFPPVFFFPKNMRELSRKGITLTLIYVGPSFYSSKNITIPVHRFKHLTNWHKMENIL